MAVAQEYFFWVNDSSVPQTLPVSRCTQSQEGAQPGWWTQTGQSVIPQHKVTSSIDTGESCPGHRSMDGKKLYYASSVSLKFYAFPSFPFQSSNNIHNCNSCYYLIEIIKLFFISSQKFYLFPILFPIPLIGTCGVNEWLCGTLEARGDCINADLWIYNSPSASWPF